MMTKIAHMRENRKANKGFSLVELIIVMAIMVALVAVLAPQYIRYLQRSRDAVVINAAEDVQTAIKTDLIDPQGNLSLAATTNVTVNAANGDGVITVGTGDLALKDTSSYSSVADAVSKLAGIGQKTVKSNKQVTITITVESDGTYTFNSTTADMAAGG